MSKIQFNNHITRDDKRKFKGIWCDAHLWFYSDLNVMEKMFYLEIDSLDNEHGCFASNDHFSKFSGLSKNRCSEIIKSLEHKGAVTVTLTYKIKNGIQSKEVDKRIIRVNPAWERSIRDAYEKQCDDIAHERLENRKVVEPPVQVESTPIRNTEGVALNAENDLFEISKGVFEKPKTLFEKPKDKEYNLKNTNLNKRSSSSSRVEEEEDEVYTRYKNVSGRKTTPKSLGDLIKAHGKDLVLKAIDVAEEAEADKVLAYIKKLLADWKKNEITTLEQVDVYILSRDTNPIHSSSAKATNVQLTSKNPQFTTTYSHNWDLDHLDDLAQDYLERNVYRDK